METRLTGATDLRAYLQGSWEMIRSIDDRHNNSPGRFTGRAVFVPDNVGLRYQENGRLEIAAFDDDVHQVYLFRFPTRQCAAVSFSDGRPFHNLDLSGGRWHAMHRCDPDTYEGEFTLVSQDVWISRWVVIGPRKNMTIKTTYTRDPSEAENRLIKGKVSHLADS